MPRGDRLLTDRQWAKIEPLLPELRSGKQGGRPWAASRRVLEGILWIARNGARWLDLPAEYPSPATCWRRLRDWEEQDVWLTIWRTFLGELNRKGRLDWSEAFIDGSFASAKKGALESERPGGARAQSGWWWSMARVFPWESTWDRPRRPKSRSPKPRSLRSASPTATAAAPRVPNRHGRGAPRQKPQRLIADMAYDSDPLRRRLKKRGIELIAPHKSNRVRKPTQDGRSLRRYRKRWKIERTNAWIGNFRRLVVRYQRISLSIKPSSTSLAS